MATKTADTKSAMYDHKDHHEAPSKKLHHMEIHRGKNGGHMVEHHHEHMMHAPERYIFGKGEGAKMVAHIEKHAKVMAMAEPKEVEGAEAGADTSNGKYSVE